jgi:hypothetical protein
MRIRITVTEAEKKAPGSRSGGMDILKTFRLQNASQNM